MLLSPGMFHLREVKWPQFEMSQQLTWRSPWILNLYWWIFWTDIFRPIGEEALQVANKNERAEGIFWAIMKLDCFTLIEMFFVFFYHTFHRRRKKKKKFRHKKVYFSAAISILTDLTETLWRCLCDCSNNWVASSDKRINKHLKSRFEIRMTMNKIYFLNWPQTNIFFNFYAVS